VGDKKAWSYNRTISYCLSGYDLEMALTENYKSFFANKELFLECFLNYLVAQLGKVEF
jgi:hypothetical protein